MTILGQRVLAVEYEEEEPEPEQTESGLYIPPTAQKEETKNIYQVVSVGTGVEADISEGMFILVGNRTAKNVDSVPLGGNDVKIFNEGQIIGVDETAN